MCAYAEYTSAYQFDPELVGLLSNMTQPPFDPNYPEPNGPYAF